MAKDDQDDLQTLRHDAAHVMATAVLELWPEARISIGPPIEDGFYYDFEFPDGAGPGEDDLPRIEERMRTHIEADEPFERRELPVEEAVEKFRDEGQPYKVELIEDLIRDEGVETVSLYRNGPFEDLCRGPHGPSTGRIGAFKLNSLAGAYWRGDETRQMLTRIYGTAFFSQQDLEEHLRLLDEARARDHRRLGPELGLFLFRDESPGMPFWLPDGTVLLRGIEAEVRVQLDKQDWMEIKTPQVLDVELWHRSGHYDNYRENMYFTEPAERERADERRFALKPMNCPGACLVFASERHSYRELPLRLAEFGLVSRFEREGVLHGLLRVRAFTQDDGHVFCTLDQVTAEVDAICDAIDELYARFGFDEVRVELDPAREVDRVGRGVGARGVRPSRGPRAPGPRVRGQPGRGDVLRPQDRLPHHRRARPIVAVRHLPARLPDAGALRAHLRGTRQRAAPAGDDPPRAARIDGALRRDPDRAPRRAVPLWLAPLQAAILPVADRHNEYADEIAARLAGRLPRPGRLALGVGGAQDPRRRAREGAVHARRRRPRAGRRYRLGAPSRRG